MFVYPLVHSFQMTVSEESARFFSDTVAATASLIRVQKPAASKGVFIDLNVKKGDVLQAFIKDLGGDFDYFGFGQNRAGIQKLISTNSLPCLSLAFGLPHSMSEPSFPEWLNALHNSYSEYCDAGPFIVLKTGLDRKAAQTLCSILENGMLKEVGVLITSFQGAVSKDIATKPNFFSEAFPTKAVPVIDAHCLL